MKVWAGRLLMAAVLIGAGAVPSAADVKTEERTLVKFEGMLGRMAGMFGGRAARDGVVATVSVKGDRKMSRSGDTGQLIDLAGERVYELDMKKKTYKVVSFDELRARLREAQARASEAAKNRPDEPDQPARTGDEPQMEIDFDLKETGQTRVISGHACREVVMTVTVREKGKTLEDAGGMLLVSNTWLAPELAALKEVADFDRRYAQKLYGELVSVEAMQQMAAAMAMYPGMKAAMERMNKENVNMTGSPLLTTVTFQAVKGAQQAAAEKEDESASAGGGGLMGGLARRMMRRKQETPEAAEGGNRATILTSTVEVLKVSTDVAATDVDVPAGFKQVN
jgi:hypothetical protein